jgi:hypothetical protein
MKQKIFEPARHNEEAPAKGMAAVNTFNPEEAPLEEMEAEQEEKNRQVQEKGQRSQPPDEGNRH